jgi:ABC-type amino acid transport substrate-binding protein
VLEPDIHTFDFMEKTVRLLALPRWCWLLFLSMPGTHACGLPHDSEHTLERVQGHEIRIGAAERSPWVRFDDDTIGGIEPALAKELARSLGARPVFRRGSEGELLEALRHYELDVVVAGLRDDTPWKGRVALTTPYYADSVKHVLATPPGENAWLVHVERFLLEHADDALPRTPVGAR